MEISIDRVTDLESLTLENSILADTVATLADEYANMSKLADLADARKKEIMLTLRPVLESQGLKTLRAANQRPTTFNSLKESLVESAFEVIDNWWAKMSTDERTSEDERVGLWTVSRIKGREGRQTFKLAAYSLAEDALPSEVILAAVSPDLPIDCVSIPKLVQAGAKLDSINPFIHKAEDGVPYYTLRGGKTGSTEKGEK